MVKKILGLAMGEIKSVHNAAFILGLFALVSQLLALLRDKLLAHTFGADKLLDIYYAGFKVPDFLFVTVASLVSVSVLVPFIIERTDHKKMKEFIDRIFSFFFVLIVICAGVLFLIAPLILPKIFPGFKGDDYATLISVTRILLLSPILLGLSSMFGAITQAFSRFALYALSPVLYNIGIIAGVLFLVPTYGIRGLAFGVVIGAFLHLAIQLPSVIKQGLFPRVTWDFDFKEIKSVLMLSIPRTITLSASHIATIIYASFASLMTVGSIAVLNFSLNLQSVPLSIIGVSYSLAAFPTLSRLYKDKLFEEFITHISTALRHIIFWSIPISVYFIVLRAHIVRVILGSGEFSWNDTRLTAAALALFVISAVAQGAVLLFLRAFYAGGETRKPLIASLVSTLISILGAYIFVDIYKHHDAFAYFINSLLRIEDNRGGEVLMLPLAYSLGQFINIAILWVIFEIKIGSVWIYVRKTLRDSLFSAICGGFVSYLVLSLSAEKLPTETVIGIFLQGFIAGIIGILVNMGILYLFNSSELKEIMATLHRRIWKTQAIIEDSEVV